MNPRRELRWPLVVLACAIAAPAGAQLRNNGIILPQVGYLSLELFNGWQKFGSSDALYAGTGGVTRLDYNWWLVYRAGFGISKAAGDHTGPDVLTTMNTLLGVRYAFLTDEHRPFVQLDFHTMWFLYTEGTNVPPNPALGNQALFGGPRLALGYEWFFAEEMSLTFEVAAHLYVTLGSFLAPGISALASYTAYYVSPW